MNFKVILYKMTKPKKDNFKKNNHVADKKLILEKKKKLKKELKELEKSAEDFIKHLIILSQGNPHFRAKVNVRISNLINLHDELDNLVKRR